MDGPAQITQAPIPTGGTYTYEFVAGQMGTFLYHSHDHSDRQQTFGLDGALILEPRDPGSAPRADLEYTIQLQEWLKREWRRIRRCLWKEHFRIFLRLMERLTRTRARSECGSDRR